MLCQRRKPEKVQKCQTVKKELRSDFKLNCPRTWGTGLICLLVKSVNIWDEQVSKDFLGDFPKYSLKSYLRSGDSEFTQKIERKKRVNNQLASLKLK